MTDALGQALAAAAQYGQAEELFSAALAAVNSALRKAEIAVQLLAQAARLAPNRADVQQLLARTMADLGYFGDAPRRGITI